MCCIVESLRRYWIEEVNELFKGVNKHINDSSAMSSRDSFVAIVEYAPGSILAGFVGRDPLELVNCLKRLIQPAAKFIEISRPDDYKVRGELHQIVWQKGERSDVVLRSIFSMYSSLATELERTNSELLANGFARAAFRSGLSEGLMDFGPEGCSGPPLDKAFDLARQAGELGATLATSPAILKKVTHNFGRHSVQRLTREGDVLLDSGVLCTFQR